MIVVGAAAVAAGLPLSAGLGLVPSVLELHPARSVPVNAVAMAVTVIFFIVELFMNE
ncbi:hypothetical protein D3C85_1745720 [compost metagenome]